MNCAMDSHPIPVHLLFSFTESLEDTLDEEKNLDSSLTVVKLKVFQRWHQVVGNGRRDLLLAVNSLLREQQGMENEISWAGGEGSYPSLGEGQL